MKYRHILISLGLGAALLSGCGGNSDGGGDTIVGTWHKSCYLPNGSDQYHTTDFIARANNTGHTKKTYYASEDCSVIENAKEWDFTYTVGAKTVGDDGKETYELDQSGGTGEGAWEYYTMFRFLDNGNLLTAGTSDTRDASSEAQRANHFAENWTGSTRK